jgi:crotonobetainyl-CoA:carnitine CoA-transferase CaiB-like acyl-CoA transferase
MSAMPGYDLMMQASAGIMSITGEPAGTPMKVGVAITDVLTGLYASTSVLAGLYANQARTAGTDPSWSFDLALADCTLASLVNVVQGTLLTGMRPQRWGNAHPQIVPYEVFATTDGYLVLAVGADRQWERFCNAVNRPEWAVDLRFQTNPDRVEHREELVALLAALFALRSTAAWQGILTAAEVPHSPVMALDEVLATPQVAARDMVHEVVDSVGRRYRMLAGAAHWQDEPPRKPVPAPAVGEHSEEVLRQWLGYDDRRISELRRLGAVG